MSQVNQFRQYAEEKRAMPDQKATADAVIKPAPLVLGKHTAKAKPPAADKKHGARPS